VDDREGLAGDGEARESEDGFVSWDRESIKLTLNDGRVFRIQPEQVDLDASATRAMGMIDAEVGGETESLARDVLSLIAVVGKLVAEVQSRRHLSYRVWSWWRRLRGQPFSIDLRHNPEDSR
jgi:hypothetical protein